MFIRSIDYYRNNNIGSNQFPSFLRPNLYPTAYPFNSCDRGAPGSIAAISLHGYNSAVTTAVDLWPQNIVRTFPAAGFTIGVSSTSAADTAAGTGARYVQVDFLDTSYVPHTLTIPLNGQTKVSDTLFPSLALRINDVRVVATGTGLGNAGIVYVYDDSSAVVTGTPSTATKIFHMISVGANMGQGGFFTVPAGCQFAVHQLRVGFDDLTTATRVAQNNVKVTTGTGMVITMPIGGQLLGGLYSDDFEFPIVLDEKWDLTFRIACSASAVIAGYCDGLLYYK